ncbi:MAG: hypothetical protein ACRD1C_00850 [Terriglobales bacterium]
MPALIALAFLLEAVFAGVLARQPGLPQLLLWLSVAGIFYLIAVGIIVRTRRAPLRGRRSRVLIFVAAAIFRLTLLPLQPAVSHQLWRFHWDGKIEHAGFNPYVYAPANGLFNPIRTLADALVPSPTRAATHPPLAEILLHWNFNWFPNLRSEKILFVAADLLLVLLLMRMLRDRQLPPEWALIYGWSPLAVFEVAGNGHMEPVAALLALVALHWAGERARTAGVAIAASALSLWYAFVLVPQVLVASGKHWVRALRWAIATAVVLSLPFWFATQRFVLGDIVLNLRAAAAAPPFNASLYALARAWFGTHAGAILAWILTAAVVVLAAVRRLPPLRAATVILGTVLLVLPWVQPWYLLWLLPLVALYPEPAWLYFSVAVIWAYAIGSRHAWVAVEYAPLYMLLAWQSWRGRTLASRTMVAES